MREIDEFPDEESRIEERVIKVKEHSLTTEEREKIIREYNIEYSKISELDIDEVHRLYYEAGFSQRKVAEVLGYSRDQVRRLFKIQGWEPRSVGGVEKEIDPQEVYRICAEEGRSKKESAETLGCKSTKPITRILKENDWKTPLEIKRETEIDPDEVHRLHFDEGWSLIRIANNYGYKSKDIIQRMFRERGWVPDGLTRQIVYEFPSEIKEDHQIESSRISENFEILREKENITPLDVARCIEDIFSSSPIKSRIKWMKIQSEQNTTLIEVLEDRRLGVESSLNDLLDASEDSNEKVRVGFVDGRLYIRKQNISEYNWLNIYGNELFYLTSTEEKFRLVHEMRTRLGLSTNTDLGKLIDQLTDRNEAEGSGYSDIKEQNEHLRTETMHLILDTTGKTLQDLQDRIHCIGKIRGGKYEGRGGIRNPQFPTDVETIDIMFAKFFGLGLSDGHIESAYSQFVYAEKDPNRREIVVEHSKDFGDVHYHVKEAEYQIQFASVFGRALRKRGFPAGDKSIENIGLPEFIMQGSPEVVFTYFRNMWPEDGCFTIEYPRKVGYFVWDRAVVVRDPTKESMFIHPKGVSEMHLEFFEDFGTFVEEDDLGFCEKYQLSARILDNLTKSENPQTSQVAKEIEEIVQQNMSKLLQDEIETLRSTGVHAISRFMEINYFTDTGRVSLIWRGKINRKKDVMRTALQMLPDDIRKSAKVEEWMSLRPKLRLEVEQELDGSDRSYRNAQ